MTVLKRPLAFTLIELVMVIAIVSIFLATLTVKWPSSIINTNAVAQRIATDIRYVKTLAMTRGERYRINFAANSYTITNLTASLSIPHPSTGATTINLPAGVTLSSAPTVIVFDSRGKPYTNASLPGTPASSDLSFSVNAGSAASTVTITSTSGMVGSN